jgi:pimeloyl-ACP methyl ester carboxylesterase
MKNSLSRRRMLGGLATLPLLGVAGRAAARQQATFVLVHGAWHGGWCWKKLAPLLRAAGHQVYTPTLSGMGDRSSQLAPEIDLDTHINDVTAVLQYEDLREVILVGHSYGGMVITGVAEKAPDRLSRMVYVDAFLPENGKAVKDYSILRPLPDGAWRVPPLGPPSAFGVTDERDVAWVQARLGDQPLKTLTQPIRIAGDRPLTLPRTFIQCTQTPWFAEAGARAKQNGFTYRELFTAGHDAMITQPAGLARLLLELL